MSAPKLISPLLDGYIMGEPFSQHAGVSCCPAMKNDADDRYLVKIISNPASQTQLEALLLTGACSNAQAANDYFKSKADDVVEDIKILKKLSEAEGFLPFKDYQVVPMENGENGYDVYILCDYRRTLERQFQREPMTHLAAINLGLDICSALSVCRRAGYLYVDLKPSNIHIINGKEFRIGDLGFIKQDSIKYASFPDKYRSAYTAPEISDAFSCLNTTVDIYALGLILYRAYNGGQLPFTGDVAPAEKFAPPEFADYEMSEIILKACDPDPEQRWQDPMQMGQALVSYMQRNGANDTPIVPAVVAQSEPAPTDITQDEFVNEALNDAEQSAPAEEQTESIETAEREITPDNDDILEGTSSDSIEDIPSEDASSEDQADVSIVYSEDDFGNLSFLDDLEDETTQELTADEIQYDEVSDEVSEILAQADEIATYEVPEPVVAPEAVDVPIPEPIILEQDEGDENAEQEELQENDVEPVSEDENSDNNESEDPAEDSVSEQDTEDNSESEEADRSTDPDEDCLEYEEPPSPPKKHTLRNVLLILLAAAVVTVGVLFYSFYYLQRINAMTISGNESSITVTVDTKIDHNKLSVVCVDVYGTKISRAVVDGKATFTDLLGGTEYNITVTMEGFHKVIGDCKKTYYTPSVTNIVQFSVVTGSEDGSAIINFAIDGPDSQQWQISYSTDGEDSGVAIFSGHTATIKGLSVGKEYTIKLNSVDKLYLAGEQELRFTASPLIYPENLAITSFKDNSLTVSWSAPQNASVKNWSVHCYNASGYSQTLTTADTTAVFEEIDNTQNYTVEVSAEGQSVSQRTTVEENSITIDNIVSEVNENGQISLRWDCSEQIPQGGWNITCKIDGTDFESTYICDANTFIIKDTLPDQTYLIDIHAANATPVVCAPITCKTGEAKTFSCSFGGAPISGKEISLSMCNTPAKENWTRHDLNKADYTTTFKVGQKASFVIRALKLYGISDDELIVAYAIKDKDGKLISLQKEEYTWRTLWDYYYGELNIPSLPETSGDYTVTVYFNSGFVCEQAFTVTE